MTTPEQIQRWADDYLKGVISDIDLAQFEAWYASMPDEIVWSEIGVDKEELRALILSNIQQRIQEDKIKPVQHLSFFKRYGWAAAAVFILLSGAAGYFVFDAHHDSHLKSTTVSQTLPTKEKVAPGREGAILTLSNGKQLILDDASDGRLLSQGEVVISKEGGRVFYQEPQSYKDGSGTEVSYNTVSTPKGRQFQLVLSDGSKIWLNAASSITFPTSFSTSERRVRIVGEAYFEIAHNAAKPFVVLTNGIETKVLGTHFNVNSYDDESAIRITLLQGSVKVKNRTDSSVIRPGNQAQINRSFAAPIHVVANINTEEIIAWKDGRFNYYNADLKSIMRQVARWYDVEVIYKDEIEDHYTINISKNVPVSQLFRYIEMSGGVHFEIAGKKIIVKR